MFGKAISIGRLLGFDVRLSWTFLLLVAVLVLSVSSSLRSFGGLAVAALFVCLFLASLVAHELGHAVAARELGVSIDHIEIHGFGGFAHMKSFPRTRRDEIVIAAAGPAVSLALAAFFGIVGLIWAGPMSLFLHIAVANLVLGAFNLLPALPMDGGRILRAALTPRFGYVGGTRVAVRVARVVAVGLALACLIAGNFFGVVLAIVIWILGTHELRVAETLMAAPPGTIVVRAVAGPAVLTGHLRGLLGKAAQWAKQATQSPAGQPGNGPRWPRP